MYFARNIILNNFIRYYSSVVDPSFRIVINNSQYQKMFESKFFYTYNGFLLEVPFLQLQISVSLSKFGIAYIRMRNYFFYICIILRDS